MYKLMMAIRDGQHRLFPAEIMSEAARICNLLTEGTRGVNYGYLCRDFAPAVLSEQHWNDIYDEDDLKFGSYITY